MQHQPRDRAWLFAHGCFGSPDMIIDQARDTSLFLLEMASDYNSAAANLERVLRSADTSLVNAVTRHWAFRSAVSTFLNAPDTSCNRDLVFDELVDAVGQRIAPEEMLYGHPLFSQGLSDVWLWRPSSHAGEIDKRLKVTFQSIYGECDFVYRPFFEETITQALHLLQLSGPLFESVLPHVRLIVVVDNLDVENDRFLSSASDLTCGVVYLSAKLIRSSVWELAEALFHEGCHQKFFDLGASEGLLVSDYKASEFPTILPTWHSAESGRWTVDRAFLAAHVYAYLELLSEALLSENSEVHLLLNSNALRQKKSVFSERTRYLALELSKITGALSLRGQELLRLISGSKQVVSFAL